MKKPRLDDVLFRVGTGLFAIVIIALVAGIGFVLYTDASGAIWKFGWRFWRAGNWDPVAGEVRARPLIWGTPYSLVPAPLISAPSALGVARYLSALRSRGRLHPL